MLGGEHSITFGAVQALKENIPNFPFCNWTPTPIYGQAIRKALTAMLPWPEEFGDMPVNAGGYQKHEQRRR